MKEKVTNKYPFCLTDRKKIRVLKGGEMDFDNMNKGYYDEIEHKDNKLKELKKSLDVTKSWTIKESVYSNLDVPQIWKNKLTYPNEVMKIISNDNNFLNYLSKGNTKEELKDKRNLNLNFSQTQSKNFNLSNTNDQTRNNMTGGFNNMSRTGFSSRLNTPDKTGMNNSINHNKTNSHFIQSPMDQSKENINIQDSPKLFRQTGGTRKKAVVRNIRTFTEKEKREILDQYKEMYSIKKPINEMIHENTKENIKEGNFPNITKNSFNGQELNSMQKSQMFKSSIYSLLLPNKLTKNKSNPENTINSNRSKSQMNKTKSKQTFGPFLNVNYEEYNKVIEIKNPEVKRILEDIDYYGPHFSHCPSCRNKNLEFYKLMEPHFCLNILNFLKKTRKKNKYANNGDHLVV